MKANNVSVWAYYLGRWRRVFACRDRVVFFASVVKHTDGTTSYWAHAEECQISNRIGAQ